MTMINYDAPVVEIPRDGFGRPLIAPPDDPNGRLTAYTRCTTYVGCLEDRYNLGRWEQRMVASGLAARPDLLLQVNSLGPQPAGEVEVKRWKKDMDSACDAAREAAAASSSATIGTALHALTERMDRGQDLGHVPEAYRPHLDAYAEATKTFSALHIEQFTVHDELKIGGTPDRVITIDGTEGAYIADLKTGSTEFGLGKMAMQLAVYARSLIYDPSTRERTVYADDVDTSRGLIIALNAKTGVCELKWIDLDAGWEAVQIATQVRKWRSRRDLLTGTTRIDTEGIVPDHIASAINQARDADELVELWRAAGERWTAKHTELAADRKRRIAA